MTAEPIREPEPEDAGRPEWQDDEAAIADIADYFGSKHDEVTSGNGNGKPPRLALRNLASYAIRRVIWLEKPFWQAAAFILLAGRKGACKGTYLARHAARVTNGELYGKPKRVLVITSEDSIELDFLPRVVAAGGDPSMVEIIVGPFRLPDDISWIREQALALGDVGLIILDPIGNHTGGRDTDKEGPVRDAIQDLNPLADELDCMIVGVRHLGKDASRGALASVLGSTAFVDVPRCVILMARDDEDDFLFHAQVVAGNRGPRSSAGRAFRLELADVPPAEEITRLAPAGDSTKDVEELLGVTSIRSDASRSARATELILDILEADGEQESDTLDARVAHETGLAAKTVRNARSALAKDGLVRSNPTKDEYGEIICWTVSRTSAPR
jgi:predicted transcriptional regulator